MIINELSVYFVSILHNLTIYVIHLELPTATLVELPMSKFQLQQWTCLVSRINRWSKFFLCITYLKKTKCLKCKIGQSPCSSFCSGFLFKKINLLMPLQNILTSPHNNISTGKSKLEILAFLQTIRFQKKSFVSKQNIAVAVWTRREAAGIISRIHSHGTSSSAHLKAYIQQKIF